MSSSGVNKANEAGKVISELERLGTASLEFLDRLETFRQAVVAHTEAEKLEELPKRRGKVDEVEVTRMKKALARVPELAFNNGETVHRSLNTCRRRVPSSDPGLPPPASRAGCKAATRAEIAPTAVPQDRTWRPPGGSSGGAGEGSG